MRHVARREPRRLDARDTLALRGYFGDRRVTQYLAFSGAGPGSSGGVVDLDRAFGGIGVQWTRNLAVAAQPASIMAW